MGHPDIRKPDGTELTPQVTLRVVFDLYAGVRPCRLYPNAKTPLRQGADRSPNPPYDSAPVLYGSASATTSAGSVAVPTVKAMYCLPLTI